MKYALFLFISLFVAPFICAQNAGLWLGRVNEYNPEYRKIQMDRELAGMNRQKNVIEADTDGQRYMAELTFLDALADFKEDLEAYYSDLFDTAYTTAIETLNSEIAEIRRESAATAHTRSKELFQAGRISAHELEEKRIALLEYESELIQTQSQKEDIVNYYHHITGMKWDPSIIEGFASVQWEPDRSRWVENDLSYQRAEITVQHARFLLDTLADNAPRFIQQKTELQMKNARLQLETARFNAEPNYEKTVLRLNSLRKQLNVLSQRLELEKTQLEDYQQRFEEGRISKEQYTQQTVNQLLAERSYLQGCNQYMQELVGAIVTVDKRPAEVLQ
jgi:outer membrane protein TolC